MFTEEEARTKWCPFARAPTQIDFKEPYPAQGNALAFVAANRGLATGIPYDKCRCIASECMAWRWDGWVNILSDGTYEQNLDLGGPLYMPFGPTNCATGCVRMGRCGLAGQP